MEHTRPTKRPRQRDALTPNSYDKIQDMVKDFKTPQFRQVVDVALNGGNVSRSIRYIHARLPTFPQDAKDDTNARRDGERHRESSSPSPAQQPFVARVVEQPAAKEARIKEEDIIESIETSPSHLQRRAQSSISPLPYQNQIPYVIIPQAPTRPIRTTTRSPSDQSRTLSPHPHPRIYTPIPRTSCNCTASCTGTRCKCYKSGRGCSVGCTCISCVNMLNDLELFFGSNTVRASPDFMKWIQRERRGGGYDLLHEETVEGLRGMVMGEEAGGKGRGVVGVGEGVGEMMRRWRGERCEVVRGKLVRGLFRAAFGVDEGRGIAEEEDYWCFCTGEWRRRDIWRFCTLCDQCRDVGEWHCRCEGVNNGQVCVECGEDRREG
ncbi:hypothetical protein CJF31_00005008 [Rutstroemia sp. NJR-2017a BVV2]|nr:hypothetical protein CJF31_00005008 [Rutstroemia sp. NJR-2017a BVV2]